MYLLAITLQGPKTKLYSIGLKLKPVRGQDILTIRKSANKTNPTQAWLGSTAVIRVRSGIPREICCHYEHFWHQIYFLFNTNCIISTAVFSTFSSWEKLSTVLVQEEWQPSTSGFWSQPRARMWFFFFNRTP